MQRGYRTFWQKLPAFRILLPFITGIILQWHCRLSIEIIIASIIGCTVALILFWNTSLLVRFRFHSATGSVVNLLIISTACLLVWLNDVRNFPTWIGHSDHESIIAVIEEPPVERPNVYRAEARLHSRISNGKRSPCSGKLMISFAKSTLIPQYGEAVLIKKQLKPIRNTGNPGAFDYKNYSLFNGITHEVYLNGNDFFIFYDTGGDDLKKLLFSWRIYIISVFKKYLPDTRERGLAEALLIGYKNDLDKELVKAYTDTGVVHIIAISGLHLALVYGLLMLFTKPISKNKLSWLRASIVIAGLWLFSLLAGAQPSILRAAVMFTVIALKMVVHRNGSVYNSIALAALVLLAWNPFWLWDVGFQLSFLAVLSIIVFYRPVYNLLYFTNRFVDAAWKLAAGSIAAQILTVPVTLYYFHQFPLLFIITNVVAVPLSSLAVYIEILLCSFSFLPAVASFIAKMLMWLLESMNNFVDHINHLPFGVWNGIYISGIQALLLYGFLVSVSVMLLMKKKATLWPAMGCLLLFTMVRSFSLVKAEEQKTLIVYNIPKHTAVDLITGRTTAFYCDKNFTNKQANVTIVENARISRRITASSQCRSNAFVIREKRIIIIDSVFTINGEGNNYIDVAVIADPKFRLTDRHFASRIRQIVITPAVPAWKAALLARDCDMLKINCHYIVDKGAFEMKL